MYLSQYGLICNDLCPIYRYTKTSPKQMLPNMGHRNKNHAVKVKAFSIGFMLVLDDSNLRNADVPPVSGAYLIA